MGATGPGSATRVAPGRAPVMRAAPTSRCGRSAVVWTTDGGRSWAIGDRCWAYIGARPTSAAGAASVDRRRSTGAASRFGGPGGRSLHAGEMPSPTKEEIVVRQERSSRAASQPSDGLPDRARALEDEVRALLHAR